MKNFFSMVRVLALVGCVGLVFSMRAMQLTSDDNKQNNGAKTESLLSCTHDLQPYFILGALIFRNPCIANYAGTMVGEASENFYCPFCGSVQSVKLSSLILACEQWWEKKMLSERLEALMTLPSVVFHKTVKEAPNQVTQKFCTFSTSLQASFLKRFSFDERLIYLKALCKTNSEGLWEKLKNLNKQNCLLPEDKFILMPEKDRFSHFVCLDDIAQAKILACCHTKITDLGLLTVCLRRLCNTQPRMIVADDLLSQTLQAVWSRFSVNDIKPLFFSALKTAHPQNRQNYILRFWDLLEESDRILCVSKFIADDSNKLVNKKCLLSSLKEKLPEKFYTLCSKEVEGD
ncbi:TPA: hypothetical protein DDZ86_01795 [Candidatus Dependentiae bacterium]|nr:MAG: hypothetical protein UW09_C0001G0278 [candidate division TM6 bacterium GW2011_GWF2_43_87]HBL98357.1 hypothetical protein [Candidatus Dependentiae bacterium]